jgi:hypothetical protein
MGGRAASWWRDWGPPGGVPVRESTAIARDVSSERGDRPTDIPDPGDVPVIAAALAREAQLLLTADETGQTFTPQPSER